VKKFIPFVLMVLFAISATVFAVGCSGDKGKSSTETKASSSSSGSE
jgi:hypothetical protein